MEISSNMAFPQFQNNPSSQVSQIAQQFPDVLKTTAANHYVIPNTEHTHRTHIKQKRLDALESTESDEDEEPSMEQQVGSIIKKIKYLRTMEKKQNWTL